MINRAVITVLLFSSFTSTLAQYNGIPQPYRLDADYKQGLHFAALPTTWVSGFSYGDDPGYTNLTQYAWYTNNSSFMSHPVGQKLPNPWGLYDMHGNIAEWCQDWYAPYLGGIALDPQGPATGSTRVFRGGLWLRLASYCRSAWRNAVAPNFAGGGGGFRVVLAQGQP